VTTPARIDWRRCGGGTGRRRIATSGPHRYRQGVLCLERAAMRSFIESAASTASVTRRPNGLTLSCAAVAARPREWRQGGCRD
jgi:hypothetical protein